jgi:hypothetical protein
MTEVTGKTTVKKTAPEWFRVVLTHPSMNGRIVFRSLSEKRARKWVEDHFPRGSEVHLVSPAGKTESFEAERTGEHGADVPQWADFNPEDWVPAAQAPPPGQDEWADKEG